MALGQGCGIAHCRRNQGKVSGRCANALDVSLTDADIAYLEDPYMPHRIVGAICHNPPQGVMLLDEKR